MKFLAELITEVKPLIVEAADGHGKSYFIEGPFLQADIKNRNGRIYPLKTLTKEVARYVKELVEENRALGELGHPDSPTINLPLASHRITELTQDGANFHGRAHIMTEMPNGKIVKALIDEGVKLGVSSRGVGSLDQRPEGNVVGEDFYLATAGDIVADPSAPNAFVKGVMENREWVWQNGILCEATIQQIKQDIIAAPRKKIAARTLVEARAFERFLNAIHVECQSPLLEGYGDSAWEKAYRDKRNVFYEKATETIRQCPQNYCLLAKRNGRWTPYLDKASTINNHSLSIVMNDVSPSISGEALAQVIEDAFFDGPRR
jgi:hypothetical protein